MSKKLLIFLVLAVLIVGLAAYFNSMSSASLIWRLSEGGNLFLPVVVAAALVDSINPCAFSILLLTIAFLFSIGRLRKDILKIGLVYVLGIFIAYFLIGLGILQALHVFGVPHFMAKIGAVLLVSFGLINILDALIPNFPIKLRIPHGAHHKMADLMNKASLPTAFVLGALVGVCEFPCTGGPYLAVLGLLHDQVTFFNGLGYLTLYNLIFVLPLLVALFIASEERLLERAQVWQKAQRKRERLIAGFLMVGLGIIIFLV